MTEQEWLECKDPDKMLNYFRGRLRLYSRNFRLFACASCRRIWHLIPDERSRRAVEVAERFADGYASNEELLSAHSLAESARKEDPRETSKDGSTASWAAVYTADRLPFHAARTVQWMTSQAIFYHEGNLEQAHQADLLREIFGNPLRPITLNPAWLTPKVVALARAIYDDRAFDRIPVLADTLEEAGCHNADILAHCRGPGPHVRGCSALDLLLGKE